MCRPFVTSFSFYSHLAPMVDDPYELFTFVLNSAGDDSGATLLT